MSCYPPVLAPCRTYRRAAFRRVAGGASRGLWLGRGLQRFQRVGVEEKRHDAHEGDAISVGPGLFIRIAGHDDLSEVVADVAKGKGFLFALFVVGDVPCGLDVKAHVAFVDDEIYFVPLAATLAVDGREHLHGADIHRVVAPDEFVVDGILHEMRIFILPEVEP